MRGFFSVAALAALVTLAACGGYGSTGPYGGMQGSGGNTGGTNTTNAISIGNDFFSPSSTTVPVGTKVTWTWNSNGTAHTVTFDDGAPGSGTQSSGTFSRTFSTAGTYTYYCQIHGKAAMSGSITVQ